MSDTKYTVTFLENDRTYARQMGFEPSVILMVDCITACNMLLGRYTLSAIASIASTGRITIHLKNSEKSDRPFGESKLKVR